MKGKVPKETLCRALEGAEREVSESAAASAASEASEAALVMSLTHLTSW